MNKGLNGRLLHTLLFMVLAHSHHCLSLRQGHLRVLNVSFETLESKVIAG